MKQYLTQHILLSTLKQAFFMQEYGNQPWNFDVKSGTLVFGKKGKFKAQILGTYSKETGTWLWAWANTESGLPDLVTNYSKKLSDWAKSKNVTEFVTPQWSVSSDCNPELISLLSIGLLKSRAYFAGHHEHGAVYLAINVDVPYQAPKMDNMNFINHVTGVISQIPVSPHKDAVISFCNSLGWKGAINGEEVHIKNPNDTQLISMQFDNLGRLTKAGTIVHGRT